MSVEEGRRGLGGGGRQPERKNQPGVGVRHGEERLQGSLPQRSKLEGFSKARAWVSYGFWLMEETEILGLKGQRNVMLIMEDDQYDLDSLWKRQLLLERGMGPFSFT